MLLSRISRNSGNLQIPNSGINIIKRKYYAEFVEVTVGDETCEKTQANWRS